MNYTPQKTEEDEMSEKDLFELVGKLAKDNPLKFNLRKFAEECTEAVEIILKKENKEDSSKAPSDEELIEELGDVQFRLMVLTAIYGEAVSDRVLVKAKQLVKHIKAGKYVNI